MAHQPDWVYRYNPNNNTKFFACHLITSGGQLIGEVLLTRVPRNWESLTAEQQSPFWKLLESFRDICYNIEEISPRYQDEVACYFGSNELGRIRRLLHQLVDELSPRVVYPATETSPAQEVPVVTFWDTRIDTHWEQFHVICHETMAVKTGLVYGKTMRNLSFTPLAKTTTQNHGAAHIAKQNVFYKR